MTLAHAEVSARSAATGAPRYLYGPASDFFLLGGSALLVLPLMWLTPESARPGAAAGLFLLSHVINNPHFAHSYQIFYRDFSAKAFGEALPAPMRLRYLAVGLGVPAFLFVYLAACAAAGSLGGLALAANLMGFLVGWHYVKQGYGMLMVDAALKRRFFTGADKRVLLANAYLVWIAVWAHINVYVPELQLLNLRPYALPVPDAALAALNTLCALAAAATLWVFWRRAAQGGLPVNGAAAYLITLYVIYAVGRTDPLFLLAVPAIHSLQYLAVVWRFETNRQSARPDAGAPAALPRVFGTQARLRLAAFAGAGVALGFAGFHGAPALLQALSPATALGAALYAFTFAVFINVHHYFIDSVIWRRENPEAKRYLFG